MTKTITVFDWLGGGTWGLHQLIFAHFIEELSGLSISELSDVNYGRSVGAVGATSSLIRDPNNPEKPKFKMSDIIKTFYGVANDIFGNGDIVEHQKRAVEHDLRQIHDGQQRRRIFRDNSDNMHLDHSKLSAALSECYGDTRLDQLLQSTVILSQHFQSSTTVAHTNLNRRLFDAKKWSLIKNLGGQDRVIDAVMSSTAAPTVFDSYTYDGGQNNYVDGAANYGPSDILLNLQKMHREPVKFRIITLGTGNTNSKDRCAKEYSGFGFLRMGQGLNNAISNEMLHADYKRMRAMFGDIEHVQFDTDVSALDAISLMRDNKKLHYTPFNGTEADLDFIMETAVHSARSQVDAMKQTIEAICEDKIRDTMPKIASTRVTEAFYKALREKLPRLTPTAAIPFEHAILRANKTNIEDHGAFSLDAIKKHTKGNSQNLRNTTVIPQSRIWNLASSIWPKGRGLKKARPSPAT